MTQNNKDDNRTLHLSLGASANAVSAHVLNLQGLSATGPAATCHAHVTHALERSLWVPRAIFVDEATRYPMERQRLRPQQQEHTTSNTFDIQPLEASWQLQRQLDNSQWSHFWDTSQILATSHHSRFYHAPEETPTTTYRASSENPRHVVWDDDDEEEQQQDDNAFTQAERSRAQRQWQTTTLTPLQQQLDDAVVVSSPPTDLHCWRDLWMPPYSRQHSLVPLPYSHQSNMVAHWDSYQTSTELGSWSEDVLWEGAIRHWLEECDTCRGICLVTEGTGAYAGLTTGLLQDFAQDVPSAARVVVHVTNPQQEPQTTDHRAAADDDIPSVSVEEDPALKSSGWQPAHVQRFRHHLSAGLALSDFAEHAHAVLPLHMDPQRPSPAASAQLALALEATTLPLRLSPTPDPRSQLGLLNAPFVSGSVGGTDFAWGTSATSLSWREWLLCVLPASQYKILELDMATNIDNNQDLWQQIRAGTSVERDTRMRRQGRDQQREVVAPGRWLQDAQQQGGLLSSLSPPAPTIALDRSVHHHFAMSTSVRTVRLFEKEETHPGLSSSNNLSNYLTCLIQGMGVSYRPERSLATVLHQTIGELTYSNGYGAGAYWKHAMAREAPTLAVLGNTTRIYPYLNDVCQGMATVMGPRYRGFYQRDVVNGSLPEREDCEESMAKAWDLRDVYLPPASSGLLDDEGDIDY